MAKPGSMDNATREKCRKVSNCVEIEKLPAQGNAVSNFCKEFGIPVYYADSIADVASISDWLDEQRAERLLTILGKA